jgi:hypothetical protein
VAYNQALQTRYDRNLNLCQRERGWLESYARDTREVIYALLSKYELVGLRQITDPRIFRVPPRSPDGRRARRDPPLGGDAGRLRQTLTELQQRLYAA